MEMSSKQIRQMPLAYPANEVAEVRQDAILVVGRSQQSSVEAVGAPLSLNKSDGKFNRYNERQNEGTPESSVQAKLNYLISEIKDLTTFMSKISKTVMKFDNRINVLEKSIGRVDELGKSLDQSMPTIETRFQELESLIADHQEDNSRRDLEERLTDIEIILQELCDQRIQTIENQIKSLESLLNRLLDQSVPNLEINLLVLEKSLLANETKLKVLESKCTQRSSDQLLTGQIQELSDELTGLTALVDYHCKDNWKLNEAISAFPITQHLGMTRTSRKLSEVLQNSLSFSTCIELFKLSYKCEVTESARKMILSNFKLVTEASNDFWKLSVEELYSFVSCESLCASEEHVFTAICKWVEKDRFTRTSQAVGLLPAAQFSRCTLRFLQSIFNHFLVQAAPQIQRTVAETMKILSVSPKDNLQLSLSKWRNCREILFVMGGSKEQDLETFNMADLSWFQRTDVPMCPSKETRAVSIGHMIYVIEVDNQRVRSFNSLNKEWKALEPLPVFRDFICLTEEGNTLYALGGKGPTARCDAYDIEKNSWREIASMKCARSIAGSCSLQGKIYCSGGWDGYRYFKSMECYEPKNNSWCNATLMLTARAAHCMVSCGRYLWAVGGHSDGPTILSSLERFDPIRSYWTKMAPMPTGRRMLAATIYHGFLFAIGGTGSSTCQTTSDGIDHHR